MKWADIPVAAKMTAGIVPVLAAVVGWLFVTFETSSASEQKWAAHNQAIACRTVYEIEAEIQRSLEQLRFDPSLTEADREWIKEKIRNLQDKIKRIDPNGVC